MASRAAKPPRRMFAIGGMVSYVSTRFLRLASAKYEHSATSWQFLSDMIQWRCTDRPTASQHWLKKRTIHSPPRRGAPMRVLVIGSGGREHAIAWKLHQEGEITTFCAPGNPGIA